MPDLPPPRAHAPQPAVLPPPPARRWWQRPDPDPQAARWHDVRASSGLPTPGGGTALVVADLGPEADPGLVALADRLLAPGDPSLAPGYAWACLVVPDESWPPRVHPLLAERAQARGTYARTDARAGRAADPDATAARAEVHNHVMSVDGHLRYHRCGEVHLVAGDPDVRAATLASLAARGWTVHEPA